MILDHSIEVLGTVLFAIAIIHTFVAGKILQYSHRFPKGSAREAFFHLMGEIEVVFGFWAAIMMSVFALWKGVGAAHDYHASLKWTEPIFVFCIMVVAATKPVMLGARTVIQVIAQFLSSVFKVPAVLADVFVVLCFGSLAGSFITEPAAMTVAALLLASMIHRSNPKLMYPLLAVLFVNISIGGALTPFAAPPILMVAAKWQWDFNYILTHFGWKSSLAVLINSLAFVVFFKKMILQDMHEIKVAIKEIERMPLWVLVVHYGVLVALVIAAHYENTVMGIFLFFLGIYSVTQKYHNPLRLKESLLVGFFLGGIIMFGAFQSWWLTPLLSNMESLTLYFGAAGLTAITDNAALTFLGSQVEGLSEMSKYYLVAGAIAGGGLTIIANAPNAAGYSILSSKFPEGFNPLKLLVAAILPTLVALFFLSLSVDF